MSLIQRSDLTMDQLLAMRNEQKVAMRDGRSPDGVRRVSRSLYLALDELINWRCGEIAGRTGLCGDELTDGDLFGEQVEASPADIGGAGLRMVRK